MGQNSVYSSAVVCTVVSDRQESTVLFHFIPAREEQWWWREKERVRLGEPASCWRLSLPLLSLPQRSSGQLSNQRSPGRRKPCRGSHLHHALVRRSQKWGWTHWPCCADWPEGKRPGWGWAAVYACKRVILRADYYDETYQKTVRCKFRSINSICGILLITTKI